MKAPAAMGGGVSMGRRKKAVDFVFPYLPVETADFILFHETAIRRAVSEARAEISLLRASNMEGNARGGGFSDRTAAAACKRLGALPCVVLSTGETIKAPEKWLAVLDAVRAKAAKLERPRLIYDAFAFYSDVPCLVLSDTPRAQGIACKSWVRYHVLIEAREKGLVSFSDADICEAVQAAAG